MAQKSPVSKLQAVKLLRFFSGLQHQEIAAMLSVTERTVERDWRYAKAWLRTQMEDQDG